MSTSAPKPIANPRLAAAAQELSRVGSLAGVMEIVRHATRELLGADGATFVLKDGPNCFYADEDAIGPLWKGRRFPQTSCISGWVMMNAQPAVIENVFEDPRIPVEAYQPTFVRSLVMMPVGEQMPIAAIGSYWAKPYRATTEQVALLRSLAAHTSGAMMRLV